jgi:hypothetical protein
MRSLASSLLAVLVFVGYRLTAIEVWVIPFWILTWLDIIPTAWTIWVQSLAGFLFLVWVVQTVMGLVLIGRTAQTRSVPVGSSHEIGPARKPRSSQNSIKAERQTSPMPIESLTTAAAPLTVANLLSIFGSNMERDESLARARIVAARSGTAVRAISGPAMTSAADLAAILTNLRLGDVLLVQRVDELLPGLGALLSQAVHDSVFDLSVGRGADARTVRLTVPKFVLHATASAQWQVSDQLLRCFEQIESASSAS